MCEKRVARRRRARARRSVRVNPIPSPKSSSKDVAERGVASIGVRSSGNLQGKEAALTHTHKRARRARDY